MVIGEKLRSRRQEQNLSRNQLTEKIHVTPSAIANYENDISYPKPDILIALMVALDIDANYLYQDYLAQATTSRSYGQELTMEEMESIAKYRNLTEDGKQLIRMVVDAEYTRLQKQEYQCCPCFQPGIRKSHGGFLMQTVPGTIRVPQKHIPPNTDFCFQVQVNSYEPIFKKLDIVALQRRPAQHNEMGIFSVNGVCYIRTLFKKKHLCQLHSLNVTDPDIPVTVHDDFQCLGTIVGQIYGSYELSD